MSWFMRALCRVWLFSLLASLTGACTVHLFSPPPGAPPIESSATVGQGKHAVRGDITGGSGVWGPQVISYRLSLQRGVTPKLDLSLAPALTQLRDTALVRPRANIYTLRAGLKYAPLPYVALSAGLTPGGSPGGAFLANDVGLTLAAENPFLIPFVSAHGLLSIPLAPRQVRIVTDEDVEGSDVAFASEPGAPQQQRYTYPLTPRVTWGWQVSLGLKLPLTHDPHHKVLPALACAGGIVSLYDRSADYGFMTLGCTLDLAF